MVEKSSEDNETTPLFLAGKANNEDKKANYLQDSETNPNSCLDVVFEILTTTAGTSSSKSLPESVRLIQYQLQTDKHYSTVL